MGAPGGCEANRSSASIATAGKCERADPPRLQTPRRRSRWARSPIAIARSKTPTAAPRPRSALCLVRVGSERSARASEAPCPGLGRTVGSDTPKRSNGVQTNFKRIFARAKSLISFVYKLSASGRFGHRPNDQGANSSGVGPRFRSMRGFNRRCGDCEARFWRG